MRKLPCLVPRRARGLVAVAATGALALGGPGALLGQSSGDRNLVYDPALFQDLHWRNVGPSRGGRVTAVAGHRAHPYTFYMGVAGTGGVWKTENAGITWRNISDRYFWEATSIGAIRVAPSDPNIIYVSTGSDGIRSNVSTGRGVYKSTDAGETWEFLGLREIGQTGALEIHPTNPNLVYVAALGSAFGRNPERGVFRTKDGGRSWEKVLYVSDSVGAIDVELNPADPSEVYATAWRGERKPWTIISGCGRGCGDGIQLHPLDGERPPLLRADAGGEAGLREPAAPPAGHRRRPVL